MGYLGTPDCKYHTCVMRMLHASSGMMRARVSADAADLLSGAPHAAAQVQLEVGAMRSTLHVLASSLPLLHQQQPPVETRSNPPGPPRIYFSLSA